MYIALGQSFPFDKYQLVVAASPGITLDLTALRAIVRAVDVDGVIGAVRPLDDLVAGSVAGSQLAVTLIAVFAGLATLLAATGISGVVSLVGRSRRHEWAVRSALGAGPVVCGLSAGLAVSVGGARWLASRMCGLSPWEPAVLAGALVVLIATTAIAVVLPARRAARVDPSSVCRES